jgi:hypothetical protein
MLLLTSSVIERVIMDRTTKSDVRTNFRYAKDLMKQANQIMRDSKQITDFTNNSDAGQLCNELVASVAIFQIWLDEQQEQLNKKGK